MSLYVLPNVPPDITAVAVVVVFASESTVNPVSTTQADVDIVSPVDSQSAQSCA
ncbi:MAG: hypothetical protein GY938_13620 [Ketobacter sp.]|nr:hypothetical protein [Ketobacter sp.]